jgi:GINS complex subunit 2
VDLHPAFAQLKGGSTLENCIYIHSYCYLQGPTQALLPPQRSPIPLWLALLLKRQRRANIIPPQWLHPDSLSEVLELETTHIKDSFSPPPPLPPIKTSTYVKPFHTSAPFLPSCTADAPPDALPYHWLEMGEMLLEAAADDLVEPDSIRRLMRDLREVRMAKMRKCVEVLTGEGEGLGLDGVGAMEVGESRGFITGVIDGLRRIGASKEQARKEREAEERENGYAGRDEEDDDMAYDPL